MLSTFLSLHVLDCWQVAPFHSRCVPDLCLTITSLTARGSRHTPQSQEQEHQRGGGAIRIQQGLQRRLGIVERRRGRCYIGGVLARVLPFGGGMFLLLMLVFDFVCLSVVLLDSIQY